MPKSADPVLIQLMKQIMADKHYNQMPGQWEDADFVPVDNEFEKLIKVLGWVK